MKKIRVISDLHMDINEQYKFSLKGHDDCFTIIAGDTSGDPKISIKWIKDNIKSGIVVCGNHLVYNNHKKTVDSLRKQMSKAFPVDSDITYFDNNCHVISKVIDGILFIGTCLYTDYKYMNFPDDYSKERVVSINKHYARGSAFSGGLNDFRWGVTKYKTAIECDQITGELKKRRIADKYLSPDDYEKWFNESFKQIEERVIENEKLENPLPVVIVSHHAPSPKCISDRYVDNDLNASYVSDLEWFIKDHKSIKIWCCGHIHGRKIVPIEREDGSKCTIVQNPCGYIKHWFHEPSDFNPDTFINTEDWTVETNENYKFNEEIQKEIDGKEGKLARLMSMGAWLW